MTPPDDDRYELRPQPDSMAWALVILGAGCALAAIRALVAVWVMM